MTVYVLAQLSIHHRDSYNRYQAKFFEVFQRYQGQLLVSDERPVLLEGYWPMDKLVLISFPDETAFREWSESPEYLEISKHRKEGANAIVLLAQGFHLDRPGLQVEQKGDY